MNVKVYNQSGKESGEMELPKVFEYRWNPDLVHQVVVSQAANRRPVVAHAKGRGEVRGGGRKPWRQKGTGRARHGSIRSPIWKGGGVAHGPKREADFKRKVNRKMAALALAAVLSAKIRDHEALFLADFALPQSKTREAVRVLENFSKMNDFRDLLVKERRAVLLLPDANSALRRAFRNVPAVEVREARNVTALDVINRKYVILPTASVEVLAKRLGTRG